MKEIAKRYSLIEPSPIRKVFNMVGSRKNTLNLVLGEPDFTTPTNIIEASNKAFLDGHTHYVHNSGIIELRDAIGKRLKTTTGSEYSGAKQVIITAGAQEALYLTMQILLNDGDEVVVSSPFYPPYLNHIRLAGGIPVFAKATEENKFSLTADAVRKVVTSRTKAILLNSPCNPTGGVISEDEMAKIAQLAIENDLYVVSDEPYQAFLYDGKKFISIASFPGMKERTIIVDSFSKSYAMTGWRVGFVACPEFLYEKYMHFQENAMSCVNVGAQYAALEAIEGPQDSLHKMIEVYKQRRELVVKSLNGIPGIECGYPSGAFYVFPNIKSFGIPSNEFVMSLYDKENMLVVPGSAFGPDGEGYFRISYAANNVILEDGVDRIRRFCLTLQRKRI